MCHFYPFAPICHSFARLIIVFLIPISVWVIIAMNGILMILPIIGLIFSISAKRKGATSAKAIIGILINPPAMIFNVYILFRRSMSLHQAMVINGAFKAQQNKKQRRFPAPVGGPGPFGQPKKHCCFFLDVIIHCFVIFCKQHIP